MGSLRLTKPGIGLFIQLSIWAGTAQAQNLIPNPRFEQISDCPTALIGRAPLELAPPWYNPNQAPYNDSYLLAPKVCVPAAQWIDAPLSDGFIVLYSTYQAEAGRVVANRATYASAPLIQPPEAGKYYWFSMRAILAGRASDGKNQEENSYGLLLSENRPAFANYELLSLAKDRPQLVFTNRATTERRTFSNGYTDNFAGRQIMQGCFQAQGNERYLTLGDFLHPNYTNRNAGLYFTDLSLTKMPDRIDLGPDTSICAGQNLRLDAHFAQYSPTYRWQDGSTDSTFLVTKSGLYSLTITSSCRTYTDTIRVNVRDPGLEVGADTSVCEGKAIVLDAGTGFERYRWDDGATTPTLTVTKPGVYGLEVERFGCQMRDSVRVYSSSECCQLYLPTAFSPDADGVNDQFAVVTGCADIVRELELVVYNRWGEVVFRSNDLSAGWDGRYLGNLCKGGLYGWQLQYTLPDRKTLIHRHERGTVLLMH